ncbi:hypothetical protein [Mycobacterium sp. SMC-4]|uniref:hypothetical protein n=1 Tax=Mycobacterium sp. SMC-4 TaxID=2857059 RepID=UPI0021B3A0BD|nr:hypothetical protein [Mycobacterium sp. SMC-4]UXA19819.1 hypothetical protein KXD98_09630 [Mycobacterium sp. SMC-4]
MPRADRDPAVAHGLREHLIGKVRAEVARLAAAECDWYNFGPELQRQRDRVDALLDGADVTAVYRHELPPEHTPPRDGTIVYTLRGDRLIHARRKLRGTETPTAAS